MPGSCRRAALAASLAVALLAALPLAQAQTDISPGECATLPFDFNWYNFDYTAMFASPGNLSEGCTFRISSLYMRGTCTSQRNNNGAGCSGSSGSTVSATSCQAVFADAPSGALHTPPVPGSGYTFDSGSLCTQSDVGYFFAQYSCTSNATQPLRFNVTLDYNKYSGGCGGGGFPSWSRYFLGVVLALLAVLLLAFAFKRCCQRRQAAPAPGAVQLAPSGAGAGGGGGYYTGSAAYGAAPGGPPAYAGAWGAAPGGGPAPGYGPAGGYGGYGASGPYGNEAAYGGGGGAAPPHFPPPMTTVTLGQPADEAPGAGAAPPTGAAGFPPPTGAPGYPPPSGAAAADSQSKV